VTKQELTLNLTLDQARALIAIQALMRDPHIEARFSDQVMKRFQGQNCGRLINAWDGMVLQAQLRCKEPPGREHAALIVRGIPDVQVWSRIVGCTCGWRTPSSAADSDTAFAEHLAIARAVEGPPP
jgi:hypothetical protein